MLCHNGSNAQNYAGPGITDPHPFPGAQNLTCTICHGGNPKGQDKGSSHVPPPPQVGDRQFQVNNREAHFNKLTLTGLDQYPDYTVNGQSYTALDYLQFVNPGDLRVVTKGRSCGGCHQDHSDVVAASPLATSTGIFSGATYAAGLENAVPGSRGLYEDTAADTSFRAVQDQSFDPALKGTVAELIEFPVHSVRNQPGIHGNEDYDADNQDGHILADNRVATDSTLAHLYQEQVAFTCGDCHLGSAGANNRYGDFRGSGCTACHMPYSLDGRARHSDPNVNREEPFDPDDLDPPERPHIRAHRIVSAKQTLSNGTQVEGIDDYACAGCHQGSNRTVMQYWGIRLDQNEDLRRGFQYPYQPERRFWQGTRNDPRLFDPVVNNRTFNGRDGDQYIEHEDYDGDGRDDTPADVHYEAGMGCIDCHGSVDLHGGNVKNPADRRIVSRMEHAVQVSCEDCHGSTTGYAATVPGTAFNGQSATLAVDGKGNLIDHVIREADGNFYLYSRLTGKRHFVVQTRDTVVDSGATNPMTQQPVYSKMASFAMGRDDGAAATGIGPDQGGPHSGFAHSDTMNCASCHAAWTNTCMGCHLEGEYNTGNNFSNINGKRIVYRERFAEFVYQSPVFFQLGVNARNRITQVSSNTKMFYRWKDRAGKRTRVYAFTDRNASGNNPAAPFPSMGHNAIMAHSIRGKVNPTDEGPRYCVACHLTDKGLADYGTAYDEFRTAMANNQYNLLKFDELKLHFGQNPGNRLNSPLWVHMVAGLGSGLFLFNKDGGAVNDLDQNRNRFGSFDPLANNEDRRSPKEQFDITKAFFNLDRTVDLSGRAQGSSNHFLLNPGVNFRDGALNPNLAGPLGLTRVRRLTDPTPGVGIVLVAWVDADGVANPAADTILNPPPPATLK